MEAASPIDAAPAKQTMGDRLKAAPWGPITTLARVSEHVLAALAFTQPFQPIFVPIMLGMYVWMCMATGLYLHRTVSHRALEPVAPLRFFFAFGTSVSLGGDPIRWAAIHRHHHGYSDTPNDIHSPVHGFHYAQGFWAHKIDQAMLQEMLPLAGDVRHYWFHRWLFNPIVYLLPHLAVALTLGAIWGWPGVLWCLYVPLVALIHVTHAVNSFGHMPAFGYRRFETRDTSTNVPWLALFTLGDSWHNNHHAAPRRAGHGLAWYEIDLNKCAIWILERLGLVRNVVW